MSKNLYVQAIAVVAIGFMLTLLIAWLIRQLYFIINDIDNWALSILNRPITALAYGAVVGVVYLVAVLLIGKSRE